MAETEETLFEELYDELKIIARSHMNHQKVGHTLQPTALINEAYLKLVARKGEFAWKSDRHFLCTTAEVMRQILVDSARAKASQKRGGEFTKVELQDHDIVEFGPQDDILSLHEALLKLEEVSAEKAELVQLRYFAGLTISEAAEILEISRTTASNYWNYSRAWLHRELTSDS